MNKRNLILFLACLTVTITSFNTVENKNLLVNGYDNKNKSEHIWQVRAIFLDNYLGNGVIKYGSKAYQSLNFKEKLSKK